MTESGCQRFDDSFEMIADGCLEHGKQDEDAKVIKWVQRLRSLPLDVRRLKLFEPVVLPYRSALKGAVVPVARAQSVHPSEVRFRRFVPVPSIFERFHWK